MARMPIEIVKIGDIPKQDVDQAISLANSVQDEFNYQLLKDSESTSFGILAFRHNIIRNLFDKMEEIRTLLGGFHPFLIAIVDSRLQGKRFGNLFGSHRGAKGLAVITIADVESTIIPGKSMASYYLYYFTRYTLSFIVPGHRNHDDPRNCVFDRKVNKPDLLRSMRARSFCDECRQNLLNRASPLTGYQFDALNRLLDFSGRLLEDGQINQMEEEIASIALSNATTQLPRIKKKLDLESQKRSRRRLWIYISCLIIIWVALIILTCIFGWDVMEPWTYFLGGGGTIGSYIYFAVTQHELSPKLIYDQISKKTQLKLYDDLGLDIGQDSEIDTN